MWEKREHQTKCWHYIFVYFVQYLQFVLDALKWPQNGAGLKFVFIKLGVLWQPHWLLSPVLDFHNQLHSSLYSYMQYEISCWHMLCWWPASHGPICCWVPGEKPGRKTTSVLYYLLSYWPPSSICAALSQSDCFPLEAASPGKSLQIACIVLTENT